MSHATDLHDFARAYPDIDLEVSVDNKPRSLTRGEADVALRVSNGLPENLVGRRVGIFNYAPFAARSLVGNDATPDLGRLPWIGWDPRMGAVMTEAWMRTHVAGAPITYESLPVPCISENC